MLLNPNEELFFLYSQDDIVVIRKLLSQAPKNVIEEKKISLDRMLVDLVADKLLQSMISQSEIVDIYHECLTKYNLNTRKMMRYASRRGAEDRIKEIIKSL